MSNAPLRIFIGYDERQRISYNVLAQSIARLSSKPVAITPLMIGQMPDSCKRTGLTPFTYSRFLVPYFNDYKGWALFLDADMLLTEDISRLFDMANDSFSVMVAKNKLEFEWASAMLFNCAKCEVLTPEYVSEAANLHSIGWAKPEELGEIPPEWNFLVGYDSPKSAIPKLIHYTQGVPAFPETKDCEYAELWFKEQNLSMGVAPWEKLMGNSVHAGVDKTTGRRVPLYKVQQ